MDERYYLLRIELLDIEPAIWRRVIVPASITLDRLHDVIQIAMGWADHHLHSFIVGKNSYIEYPEFKEDGLPCGKYRIGDLIKQKGRTFQYDYDFGDCWEHKITLEESRYELSRDEIPLMCVEGERACPPEDVGGTPGYEEFCKAIKDTNHKEHDSFLEWYGESYDSELFDTDYINYELGKYLRWSRDRHQRWGGIISVEEL